jgi:hypothetical protein
MSEVEVEEDLTLGDNRSRATYITLICVVSVLFVLVLVGFIWSLTYAGLFEISSENNEPASQSSLITSSTGAPSAEGDYIKIVGTSLVNAGEDGISVLYQGQGIMNQEKTKRFYLSALGELFLEFRETSTDDPLWIRCWRSDTGNQDGFKFILNRDGYGYILRANGSKVFCGSSFREYLGRRARRETFAEPIDDGTKEWKTPNCRAPYYRDCNSTKDIRTPPCLTSPILTKGSCYQSLIYAPYTLRFSSDSLELVSIGRWGYNANPPAGSGANSNLVFYPQLKTNSNWPVPLWRVACLVPTNGNIASECPKNLMSPEIVGDCTKCSKVTIS